MDNFNVIHLGNRIAKNWAAGLDSLAMEQVGNVLSLPFLFKHMAVMSDGHGGFGVPIGGVVATDGVLLPGAVGYDIGCGVAAMRLDLKDICKDDIIKIKALIKKLIPTGTTRLQGTCSQQCYASTSVRNRASPD